MRSCPIFADADENPGGKRQTQLTGQFQRAQPHRRLFVRRVVMRAAGQQQALADAFEHQSHARIDFLEPLQVAPTHDARIRVRQQTGFVQNRAASFEQIIERALMPALDEKLFHLRINRFRLIAEAKEHFRAAEQLPLIAQREAPLRASSSARPAHPAPCETCNSRRNRDTDSSTARKP